MEIQINQTTLDQITEQLAKDAPDNIRTGYLIGKVEGNKVIVDGVYVPEQQSNRSMTYVTSEEQAKLFQTISSEGYSIVGLAQYNANLPAYESKISRKSIEQFSQTERTPKLGLIVNSKGDYSFSVNP